MTISSPYTLCYYHSKKTNKTEERKKNKMFNKELDNFFSTKDGTWDKMIAFSPKDVAVMLGIPFSTISQFMREGKIKTYRIGRHYRVTRQDLYRFFEDNECVVL